MTENVVEILQNCKLFCDVNPAGFQRLALMARMVKLRKGQTVFRQGDPCPGVYVVGAGQVRIYKTAPGGKEHVLHMIGPGETFADTAAIGGFDMPATAEALEKTVCTLLPLAPFRRALDEDHDLCREMLTGMALWVRRLVGQIEDIVLRDAVGRLARYLLESPHASGAVALPALKRHLASHLNLTSETFSRTLRRLVAMGLVAEEGSSRLRLVDRKGLAMIAEGAFPEV